jgi:L-lysine 6-oxidase
MQKLSIHPLVGVARLGNSDEFYLAPEAIGGRPIECDAFGNEQMEGGIPRPITVYKDGAGRVKRQAARFRVMAQAGDQSWSEVIAGNGLKSVEWCVHVANKKGSGTNSASSKEISCTPTTAMPSARCRSGTMR